LPVYHTSYTVRSVITTTAELLVLHSLYGYVLYCAVSGGDDGRTYTEQQ